jgi:hypothetical protein
VAGTVAERAARSSARHRVAPGRQVTADAWPLLRGGAWGYDKAFGVANSQVLPGRPPVPDRVCGNLPFVLSAGSASAEGPLWGRSLSDTRAFGMGAVEEPAQRTFNGQYAVHCPGK